MMKIFLSWSGSRSKQVALALRNWIPLLLHYTDPWLSEQDIEAGERWSAEVGKELEASNFGVICLTRDNLTAEWILFEAGALSKALQASSVCPYLLDVEFRDITGPLSQFQAKKAERNHTYELLEAINGKSPTPIEHARLRELFEALWPKLEERLASIPASEPSKTASRSRTDVLEELVLVVRTFDSRLSNFENVFRRQLGSTRSSSSRPPPSRSTRISLTSETDTPEFKAGELTTVDCLPGDALSVLANLTGLSVDSFGKEWYVRDGETNQLIETQELDGFFKKPHVKAVVTYIPF